MRLLIVESPSKIKTLRKFLDSNWKFAATRGHIYDLPKKEMGIDDNYEPNWVTDDNKTVAYLRQQAKGCEQIYISSDPDREGEGIAWQVEELILNKKNTCRLRLESITSEEVKEKIENPGRLDMNMVHAQWARRLLDRLAGYKVSPFLIRAFKGKKLSAGRVQSATLARIVERQREIDVFKAETFYNIEAQLLPSAGKTEKDLKIRLVELEGQKIGTSENEELLTDQKKASEIVAGIAETGLKLKDKIIEETTTNPAFPFDSSRLLATASNWFGWPAGKTMKVAQSLYEKGLITYHRSDSTRLSRQGCASAAAFIREEYGVEFHQWRGGGGGDQEGHEAIRAKYAGLKPEELHSVSEDQRRLYSIIWQRYIQSQMKVARWKKISLKLHPPDDREIIFSGSARTIMEPGFFTCSLEGQTTKPEKEFSAGDLGKIKDSEDFAVDDIEVIESETRGPSHYNEGGIVSMMREQGIGRPSTYAATIGRLFSRRYVKRKEGRIIPTQRGIDVIEFLEKAVPAICDVKLTRDMEKSLDKIAAGTKNWKEFVREFDGKLSGWLEEGKGIEPEGSAEGEKEILEFEVCPRCGGNLILRQGRYGKFVHCEEKECDFSSNPPAKTYKCPRCGRHMIKRKGKKSTYYNCIAYPECEGKRPVGKPHMTYNEFMEEAPDCPECGDKMELRKGKWGKFWGCSNYPDCKGTKST
ncbi:MAG: type I DNA topoisomerase [bacterium]